MLFNSEILDQLPVHEKQVIKSRQVRLNVHLTEVSIVVLQREVLEDLLSLGLEEAADFLDSRELLKEVSVL